MISLTREPIDVAPLLAATAQDGAVAVFLGVVRGTSDGREVVALEYEAYDEMAVLEMERLEIEIRERCKLSGLHMVHRLGRLTVGETAVAIVAFAAHRPEAFAGCRQAIDELKRRVPIWKREFYATAETGAVEDAVWIGQPDTPDTPDTSDSSRRG